MRQDARPVLKLHTPRNEPQGFSRLRRVASAAKETEPELAEWLEQAVTNVESGTNPKTAFSLARRRGRPTTSNKDGWQQIVVGVHVNRLRDDGLSYEEAVAQVAEERFLSESSVKRYFKKYRPFMQLQDAWTNSLSAIQGICELGTEMQQTLRDLGTALDGAGKHFQKASLSRLLPSSAAIVRGQTGKK